MRVSKIIIGVAFMAALAGCMQTDGERALAGAGAGALIASATDNDLALGAAIGGLAGATCDDMGVCN